MSKTPPHTYAERAVASREANKRYRHSSHADNTKSNNSASGRALSVYVKGSSERSEQTTHGGSFLLFLLSFSASAGGGSEQRAALLGEGHVKTTLNPAFVES